MPKLKSHSGTTKRIKLSSKGKVIRRHAGGTHFNQKKSKSRKRAIAVKALIKGKLAKNVKRALGV